MDKTDAADEEPGFAQAMAPGSLYVVATPLGNLADLSYRARDVLSRVDRIFAEDTRVTSTLLARHGIVARPVALHAHNEARRIGNVLDALRSGERVALVTDAGTPAISDPGARIVRAVHEAGHRVVPIPGASAVATAVSAAGLHAERFAFIGFLPGQAKARRELVEAFASLPAALVFYEAPHRVRETVAFLAQALGAGRTLVVARELTKRFEEIARMPLGDAVQWIEADANRVRGEFVLVVDAAEAADTTEDPLPSDVDRWLGALLTELPPSSAARVVASVTGARRDAVYARAMALKPKS